MAHRGTIYNVRVHKKRQPNTWLPLGNIDGDGTYLAEFLESAFSAGFSAVNDANERDVACTDATLDGEDLKLSFRHGERGIVAEIRNDQGGHEYDQKATDTHRIRCGSLMRLPRNSDQGWWAVHLNGNRSIKGLVEKEVQSRFRDEFDDLVLIVEPCVMGSVLEQALADNQLEGVKLVKYDRGSDVTDANQWIAGDTRAKIELRLSAIGRGKRLVADLASRALASSETFGQITVFEGIPFDEAKVEVRLDDGGVRTFNLATPDAGHPFSENIEPATEGGEPTKAGVWTELRRIITELT